MDFKLVITDAAALDLCGIVDYIAIKSVERANAYHNTVMKRFKQLQKDPLLGRPHTVKKFRLLGYRELVIESHVATYSVDSEKKHVNIIRVLHGAMDKRKHLKL